MESRMYRFRWNPGSILADPVSLESGIHASGSGIHGMESAIRGPPGFLYIGRFDLVINRVI